MVQVLVWKEAGTLYTVKVNNNHPKMIIYSTSINYILKYTPSLMELQVKPLIMA